MAGKIIDYILMGEEESRTFLDNTANGHFQWILLMDAKFLSLISKKNNSTSFDDFHPTSLCVKFRKSYLKQCKNTKNKSIKEQLGFWNIVLEYKKICDVIGFPRRDAFYQGNEDSLENISYFGKSLVGWAYED